jgi:hypothetical protein
MFGLRTASTFLSTARGRWRRLDNGLENRKTVVFFGYLVHEVISNTSWLHPTLGARRDVRVRATWAVTSKETEMQK